MTCRGKYVLSLTNKMAHWKTGGGKRDALFGGGAIVVHKYASDAWTNLEIFTVLGAKIGLGGGGKCFFEVPKY